MHSRRRFPLGPRRPRLGGAALLVAITALVLVAGVVTVGGRQTAHAQQPTTPGTPATPGTPDVPGDDPTDPLTPGDDAGEEGQADLLQDVQDAPRGVTRLGDIGFGIERARGETPVQEFFFPGPGDFTLADTGSQLVLRISHSNLLLPDVSTVNVVLNFTPLEVIRLDETNVDPRTYEIPIPRDLIAEDFNRLTLEYKLDIGLICGDPFHPALFATVHPETRLQLAFAEDPPVPRLREPNLSEYPYPFFRAGFPVVAPVTIVVPDEPNEAELTSAYRLATDLATRVFFDLDLLTIRRVSDLSPTERRERQLILVGNVARNPLVDDAFVGSTFALRDGQITRSGVPLDPAFGVLAVTPSPWNDTLRTLAVTGQTDEGLGRALDAITNPEPSGLFAGPDAVLTEPVVPPANTGDFVSVFTFEDVSFTEVTLRGASEQTTDVLFSAPALAPGTDGQLELILSTPDALDRRRSNVLVELNGQVVQTVELTNEETRRAVYRVDLPTDSMRVGPNQLRLRSTMYTAATDFGPCESNASERVWVTMHADSAISLPETAEVATATDLSSIPFPFAGLLGIQDTVFVIDSASQESLRGGMLAAITLGRRANARHDFTVMHYPDATAEVVGDHHMVVVGIPVESPLSQQLSTVLPLVFAEDGSRALVEEEDVLTEILDTSRLSAIQEAGVPWARQRTLLSVSGTDTEALTWATGALTRGGLDGNVALLQSPTAIQTFALERLSDAEIQARLEERFTQDEARERTIVGFLLLGVGAGVAMGLWVVRHRLPFSPF